MAEQKDFSRTVRIDLTPKGPPSDEQTRLSAPIEGVPSAVTPRRTGPDATPLDEFLDCLYDAALITTLQGRIKDANPRATEFLLYTRDETRALHLRQVIHGAEVELLASLEDHLEKGDFALIQGFCVRKDRSVFPAEIAVNMLRKGGRRLCFFIRDITRRKQTEDLLRTGHNAMQTAATGIAILNREGRFDYVNPAMLRLWNLRQEGELLGRSLLDLTPDEASAQAMLSRVIDRQEEWSGELDMRRGDGSHFTVQITAACNRDADGEANGAVLSVVDITDSKRAEEALRESERQHAMLASLGAACHHLAQPATVLIGNISILQGMTDPSSEEMRDVVNSSADAAQDLARILHRLNTVNQYRTMPYLRSVPDHDAPENRMLDI